MNEKELIEFLAILDKMKIHSDPYLSDVEKELYKQAIDEIRKQAQKSEMTPHNQL